eukprot:g30456.t1
MEDSNRLRKGQSDQEEGEFARETTRGEPVGNSELTRGEEEEVNEAAGEESVMVVQLSPMLRKIPDTLMEKRSSGRAEGLCNGDIRDGGMETEGRRDGFETLGDARGGDLPQNEGTQGLLELEEGEGQTKMEAEGQSMDKSLKAPVGEGGLSVLLPLDNWTIPLEGVTLSEGGKPLGAGHSSEGTEGPETAEVTLYAWQRVGGVRSGDTELNGEPGIWDSQLKEAIREEGMEGPVAGQRGRGQEMGVTGDGVGLGPEVDGEGEGLGVGEGADSKAPEGSLALGRAINRDTPEGETPVGLASWSSDHPGAAEGDAREGETGRALGTPGTGGSHGLEIQERGTEGEGESRAGQTHKEEEASGMKEEAKPGVGDPSEGEPGESERSSSLQTSVGLEAPGEASEGVLTFHADPAAESTIPVGGTILGIARSPAEQKLSGTEDPGSLETEEQTEEEQTPGSDGKEVQETGKEEDSKTIAADVSEGRAIYDSGEAREKRDGSPEESGSSFPGRSAEENGVPPPDVFSESEGRQETTGEPATLPCDGEIQEPTVSSTPRSPIKEGLAIEQPTRDLPEDKVPTEPPDSIVEYRHGMIPETQSIGSQTLVKHAKDLSYESPAEASEGGSLREDSVSEEDTALEHSLNAKEKMCEGITLPKDLISKEDTVSEQSAEAKVEIAEGVSLHEDLVHEEETVSEQSA